MSKTTLLTYQYGNQYGESIYLSEAFQHAGLDFAMQK